MTNNIVVAHDWTRFLVAQVVPKIAIIAPAIPYVSSGIDVETTLAMMATLVPVCHGIVDVNEFAGHMGKMHHIANLNGLPSVNLLRWGRRPPWDDHDAIREVNAKFSSAPASAKLKSVRIMMSARDVMSLREAEEKLVLDPDNISAAQVIREIIAAAAKP